MAWYSCYQGDPLTLCQSQRVEPRPGCTHMGKLRWAMVTLREDGLHFLSISTLKGPALDGQVFIYIFLYFFNQILVSLPYLTPKSGFFHFLFLFFSPKWPVFWGIPWVSSWTVCFEWVSGRGETCVCVCVCVCVWEREREREREDESKWIFEGKVFCW